MIKVTKESVQIRERFVKCRTKMDFSLSLESASKCDHPHSQWLCSIFFKTPETFEEAADILLARQKDPRAWAYGAALLQNNNNWIYDARVVSLTHMLNSAALIIGVVGTQQYAKGIRALYKAITAREPYAIVLAYMNTFRIDIGHIRNGSFERDLVQITVDSGEPYGHYVMYQILPDGQQKYNHLIEAAEMDCVDAMRDVIDNWGKSLGYCNVWNIAERLFHIRNDMIDHAVFLNAAKLFSLINITRTWDTDFFQMGKLLKKVKYSENYERCNPNFIRWVEAKKYMDYHTKKCNESKASIRAWTVVSRRMNLHSDVRKIIAAKIWVSRGIVL